MPPTNRSDKNRRRFSRVPAEKSELNDCGGARDANNSQSYRVQPQSLLNRNPIHLTTSYAFDSLFIPQAALSSPFLQGLISTTKPRFRETSQITTIMSQNSSPTNTNSSIGSVPSDLDPDSTSKVLVYTYRVGVSTSSQQELYKTVVNSKFYVEWQSRKSQRGCFATAQSAQNSRPVLTLRGRTSSDSSGKQLTYSTDPNLRCSKLAIPRGKSRLQIHQEDLYPESCKEREEYVELPNAKNNLASIILPRLAYYGRLLMGRYKNLYIVSPSSPNSSPESSQYSSTGNSRQQTFHHEHATAGAETETS